MNPTICQEPRSFYQISQSDRDNQRQNIHHTNDTVQFYLQKLSDIRKETDSVISTNTVFIIVMTVCAIVILCCIFKLCFTSTHTKKPTFRSYRLKEWTRQVHHYHQINEPNNDNIIRTQARKPNKNRRNSLQCHIKTILQ